MCTQHTTAQQPKTAVSVHRRRCRSTASARDCQKKSEKRCFFSLLSPSPRPPSLHRKKNRLEPKQRKIVRRSTAGLSPSITTTTITTTTLPPTTNHHHHQPTNRPTTGCDPPSTLRLSFSPGGRRHTSNQSPKTKFATVRKMSPTTGHHHQFVNEPIAMQKKELNRLYSNSPARLFI